MERNRRSERKARALLAYADRALDRAAANLFAGEPLAALRNARTAQQLLALDSAARQRRRYDADRIEKIRAAEKALAAQRQALEVRALMLDRREHELNEQAKRLAAEREGLRALYVHLYNKKPNDTSGQSANEAAAPVLRDRSDADSPSRILACGDAITASTS